ncbi:MAG: FAD-dependent oxidoreductase [Pseudomonadota bacterium]
MQNFDVIVIGQGYAGLTAAKLAAERGLRTANFEEMCFGGLVLNLNELDPVPEGDVHSGSELSSILAMGNMEQGVVGVFEAAETLACDDAGLWTLAAGKEKYSARNVVIASGAQLRKLGVPGEVEYRGRGVSECADCDGPMYVGMEAVVVGGGDSAFQEAVALAAFASKVTIIMRGAEPRARAEWRERVASNPKIAILANSRVLSINGAPGKGVVSVRLDTDGAEHEFPCAGVFVFIGLTPNTSFVPSNVARDDAGALITSANCATAMPGLWAIGAVRSGYGGMLTDAAADAGLVAAALAQQH